MASDQGPGVTQVICGFIGSSSSHGADRPAARHPIRMSNSAHATNTSLSVWRSDRLEAMLSAIVEVDLAVIGGPPRLRTRRDNIRRRVKPVTDLTAQSRPGTLYKWAK